jgi:hypothetical protein
MTGPTDPKMIQAREAICGPVVELLAKLSRVAEEQYGPAILFSGCGNDGHTSEQATADTIRAFVAFLTEAAVWESFFCGSASIRCAGGKVRDVTASPLAVASVPAGITSEQFADAVAGRFLGCLAEPQTDT